MNCSSYGFIVLCFLVQHRVQQTHKNCGSQWTHKNCGSQWTHKNCSSQCCGVSDFIHTCTTASLIYCWIAGDHHSKNKPKRVPGCWCDFNYIFSWINASPEQQYLIGRVPVRWRWERAPWPTRRRAPAPSGPWRTALCSWCAGCTQLASRPVFDPIYWNKNVCSMISVHSAKNKWRSRVPVLHCHAAPQCKVSGVGCGLAVLCSHFIWCLPKSTGKDTKNLATEQNSFRVWNWTSKNKIERPNKPYQAQRGYERFNTSEEVRETEGTKRATRFCPEKIVNRVYFCDFCAFLIYREHITQKRDLRPATFEKATTFENASRWVRVQTKEQEVMNRPNACFHKEYHSQLTKALASPQQLNPHLFRNKKLQWILKTRTFFSHSTISKN